jgi:sRNA-binding carbon storage regulator CsrA
MNDIDEKTWHRLLQHREQRRLKLNSLYLITDMVVHVLSDMIRISISAPEHDNIHKQIAELKKYVQGQYEGVCRAHGGKIPSCIKLFI